MNTSTQVIIIGGSIGGLLAAHVAARHFDDVIIIERDRTPDGTGLRAGTPQARHIHTLLARGYQGMEALLPGITQELEDLGAPFIHWGLDTIAVTPFGWSKRFETGVGSYGVSRAALEAVIRRRVLDDPKIRVMTEADVVGLIIDDNRVTGVRLHPRRSDEVVLLTANLVIDASGRGSDAPSWLEAYGYDAPEETFVPSTVGYATRWYERPKNVPDWKALSIRARPTTGENRGGLIMEVEAGQWMVLLSGYEGEYPSNDAQAYLDYARSLAAPDVYEQIKDLRPLSPIYGYRFPGSRWRRYEKLERMPDNFILVGDAVCSFNPIYGQGMTVATMEVQFLARMLSLYSVLDLQGFAARYQRHVAKIIHAPWGLATADDKRLAAGKNAPVSRVQRMMRTYFDTVVHLVSFDPVIAGTFVRVANLLSSPSSLLHPRIVWRVLRYKWGRRGRDAQSPKAQPAAYHMHHVEASR